MHRMFWRSAASMLTLSLMALVLLSFSISMSSTTPVEAQDPTATPNDPVWIGFSLSRDAIQIKEKVRLPIVKNWTFEQDDWSAPNAAHPGKITGIDSCNSKVLITEASKQLFGFTYTITSLQNKIYTARVSFDLKAVVVCDIVQTAAVAAPAANGTPIAGLPAPVAGSAAGGTFELGGHVDGMTPAAIDAMKRSGMIWVKKQIGPNIPVANIVNEIKAIQGNGFKVLFGIVGDKNAVGDAAYVESFGAYAASVAAAGANAIEIWNEPNIDREWPAGQINGANYTKLLASVSVKIRAANPATMIISGAPAPTGFFGAAGCAAGGCNDDAFMKQMADAGAAQYIDCVGIHYNEGIVSPATRVGDPRGEYPTYYFDSMTNRAKQYFPGKSICFTELGYLSGESMGAPIPGAFAWAGNVTVAQHAAWLAEAATKASARGDVRIMIVWNINFARWDSDPMGGYAIIRPGGACPACDTLGTVMKR